jgi:hypothetical protein
VRWEVTTDANEENCFFLGYCAGLVHRSVLQVDARKFRAVKTNWISLVLISRNGIQDEEGGS